MAPDAAEAPASAASEAAAPAEPSADGPNDVRSAEGAAVADAASAPAPEPSAPTEPSPASAPPAVSPSPASDSGFFFGSYGRVGFANDLAGRTGRDTDIVRYGPRIDEPSYAELQFRREDRLGAVYSRVVFTLALLGPFFHFDGRFDESWAVRQLYAEAEHVGLQGLALWAGSRIARGDDIYLFDFWPLDNLNLVGGGARWAWRDRVETLVHVGSYRLADQYQYQAIEVPARTGIGTVELALLDRPRTVTAAKSTWWPFGRFAARGLKLVAYGEWHSLPAGERRSANARVESLPPDDGLVAGVQLGAWHGPSRSFGNAFFRVARGLAAWNPLESPFAGGGAVTTTPRALELMGGLVGNVEHGPVGVQFGAWARSFRDQGPAGEADVTSGAVAEGAVAVRPHLWLGDWFGVAAEASYQQLVRSRVDEVTGRLQGGRLGKFAIFPFVTPKGRGTYTRPHLRLIYALTLRDDDAMNLFPDEDRRSRRPVEHFLGVMSEWWFDSSYR